MNCYAIIFHNESGSGGTACIFQETPVLSADVFPLAWFATHASPSATVEFQWILDYAFVWAATGRLRPGMVFAAAQLDPAEPSTANAVTFTDARGFYTFGAPTAGPEPERFYIAPDATIPRDRASIGVAMSGKSTFAAQAVAGRTAIFGARPRYWIAFGDFRAGEVLDVASIRVCAEVPFPPDVQSMRATLHADLTWTIEPA